MKKLLLILLMAASFQAEAFQVVLNFKDKSEAFQWYVWYLDGGGEQSSGYQATDWAEGKDRFVLDLEYGVPYERARQTLERRRAEVCEAE